VRVLSLILGGLQLVLEEGEGFCEVIALCGEVLDELVLAVDFFLWAAISEEEEEGREGRLTASCWSFAPRVLRMVATFETRALCWAARASFSSRARLRSSVSCSREGGMLWHVPLLFCRRPCSSPSLQSSSPPSSAVSAPTPSSPLPQYVSCPPRFFFSQPQASRLLARIVAASSRLQYTIALAKHRLLDIHPAAQNPPYAARLRLLTNRENAWSGLRWKARHTLKLPPTGSVYEFVGGIYGNGREDDNRITASISFLELPTSSSDPSRPLRTWTHPMGDVTIIDFTMDPSQDLLVLVAVAPLEYVLPFLSTQPISSCRQVLNISTTSTFAPSPPTSPIPEHRYLSSTV
jgi:hypothetical protein